MPRKYKSGATKRGVSNPNADGEAKLLNNNNDTSETGRSKSSGKGELSKNQRSTKTRSVKTQGKKTTFSIFPKRTEILIFLVTLVTRTHYVSHKKNWWILHPDEVFQIVEVAHSEVYGYGFRPYEYLPPPQGKFSSRASEVEAQLGMYGLRSFILPKLFMIVFTLAEAIGITDQPFLVAKVFHAAVSSFLPVSMFKLTKILYSSHDASVVAAILGAASLHLSMFGTHVLVNSLLSPVVFWGMASVLDILLDRGATNVGEGEWNGSDGGPQTSRANSDDNKPSTKLFDRKHFISGMILGMCSYIRVDLLLFLVVFFCPFFLMTMKVSVRYVVTLTKLGMSFTVGMTIAGLDDYISYGWWFISTYQWLRFNLATNLAATFFGKDIGTKYVDQIVLCNWAAYLLTAMVIAVIIYQATTYRGHQLSDSHFITSVSLFGICSLLLVIYSLQPHKEIRFLHNVIVVWCILQAKTMLDAILLIDTVFQYKGNFQRLAIYLIPLAYVIFSWVTFPNSSDGSYLHWTFSHNDGSHDVNQCISYVSRQNDVRGVFLSMQMQSTGVYSLLHKDVPLLTLLHQEFVEYSNESRITVPSVNPLRLKQYNISLGVVNKVSDYITSQSMPYLYRRLVEDRKYNYAIIPREAEFGELGYKEVFRSGVLKVAKRSLGGKSEKSAKSFVEKLPVWTNATVLEYESSWLISLGNPAKAIPRLEHALTLNDRRIRVYQLLGTAYEKVGNLEKALAIQSSCYIEHGRHICIKPQVPVELYSMYTKRTQEIQS